MQQRTTADANNQSGTVYHNPVMLAESIDEFLAELKESDRKIFVCRYWYFDPIEEIASRFGYTPSKVKMSLKRSRDKLKQHLIKEGIIV